MTENPDNKGLRTPAFKKLTKKELKVLRDSGIVKMLKAGDVLRKKEENEHTLYIIINGKIKLTPNLMDDTPGDGLPAGRTHLDFAHLGAGDWVNDVSFSRTPDQAPFAAATEKSIVITIDQNVIEALEEKTQLRFYKQLNHRALAQVSELTATGEKLAYKNRHLIDDVYFQRSKSKTDFRHMEMIRGIIKKIPRLPTFANTLSAKLLEDKLSADEVADELMTDPSLAATVLKTINSAYYGFEKKISEIRYAIVLLGFDSIYQIVIAEGVKRTMPDTPAFKELLTHSIIISHLASEISHVTEIGSPPEIATIGLLHELGQVVIQLLKDKNPKLSNLINVLDRAQMGALLLKTWNLPDVIWQSVEFQSYPEFSLPEKIPGDVRNNAAIIHLAHLCYEVFRGRPEEELPVTFLDEYARLLQWESLPVGKIATSKLLPALSLKVKTLPMPLRQLLKPHIK